MKEMDWTTKQTLNLVSLQEQYRNTGRAAQGAEKLLAAIKQNKNRKLKTLLRNHEDQEVYKEAEIIFRDEVDFLLKFYSLVELSILTGYIAQPLPTLLQEEIILILNNPHVKKYYLEYYPLLLPQILLNALQNGKIQEPIGERLPFLNLILIDKLIDGDVENFLWLLDSGEFGYYDLNVFKRTLRDVHEIQEILAREPKDRTEVDKVFWGFLKYIDYLEKFAVLLKKNGTNELLNSALWHFQGYWFARIHRLLRTNLQRCIALLEVASLKKIKNGTNATSNLSINFISEIVAQKKLIDEAINFTTDPNHGTALRRYYLVNSKPSNSNFTLELNFIQSAIYGMGLFDLSFIVWPDNRYLKLYKHISSKYPNLSLKGVNIDRLYDALPIFNLVYKDEQSQGFVMIHFSNTEISSVMIQNMQKRLSIFSSSIYRVEDASKPIGMIIGRRNEIKYTLPEGINIKLIKKYTENLPALDEITSVLSLP